MKKSTVFYATRPKHKRLILFIKKKVILLNKSYQLKLDNKNIFVFDNNLNVSPIAKVCAEVLKKYTPKDYKLILLNEKNLQKYTKILERFDVFHLKSVLKDDFWVYIALDILNSYGGLFLSANVITTSKFEIPESFLDITDMVLFSNGSSLCKGFIYAKKQSKTLGRLLDEYNKIIANGAKYQSAKILETFAKNCSNTEIMFVDSEKYGYEAEKTVFGVTGKHIFQEYYFTDFCTVDDFLQTTKGITYLENDYIPAYEKAMDENTFFEQNFLLAKILKTLKK